MAGNPFSQFGIGNFFRKPVGRATKRSFKITGSSVIVQKYGTAVLGASVWMEGQVFFLIIFRSNFCTQNCWIQAVKKRCCDNNTEMKREIWIPPLTSPTHHFRAAKACMIHKMHLRKDREVWSSVSYCYSATQTETSINEYDRCSGYY